MEYRDHGYAIENINTQKLNDIIDSSMQSTDLLSATVAAGSSADYSKFPENPEHAAEAAKYWAIMSGFDDSSDQQQTAIDAAAFAITAAKHYDVMPEDLKPDDFFRDGEPISSSESSEIINSFLQFNPNINNFIDSNLEKVDPLAVNRPASKKLMATILHMASEEIDYRIIEETENQQLYDHKFNDIISHASYDGERTEPYVKTKDTFDQEFDNIVAEYHQNGRRETIANQIAKQSLRASQQFFIESLKTREAYKNYFVKVFQSFYQLEKR